jgi:hypothetical protein
MDRRITREQIAAWVREHPWRWPHSHDPHTVVEPDEHPEPPRNPSSNERDHHRRAAPYDNGEEGW